MTPEVLLRLTLLRFEKGGRHAPISASPEGSQDLATPGYASADEFREAFLSLWAERLAQHITFDASLRNALLFLLPSQWSGQPCDSYYLRDDTNELTDLQYVKDHCATQHLFSYNTSSHSPFFLPFEQLLALLRPKLPQLAPTLKEWMVSLDKTLRSLRIVFIAIQSAFLISFSEVDKQLAVSQRSDTWEETRQTYCSSVCDLCCLLERQLVVVVTQTIALQLGSADSCLKTRLFTNSASKSPEAVANAVTSFVAKRLDSIAAYAAATTPFKTAYPNDAGKLNIATEFNNATVDRVRQAMRTYAEKLAAATAGEIEPAQSPQKKSTPTRLNPNSGEVESEETVSVGFTDDVAAVSLEQAHALVAPPESENLALRVATVAPADDDTLKMVQQLLADQRFDGAKCSSGASRQASVTKVSHEAATSKTIPQLQSQIVSKRLSTGATALATPKASTSPQKLKSTHKETWLFWTRLQQKLNLEDVVAQRISEQCKFDNESPYPEVFLVDLDARSTDRATVLFLQQLQALVPNDHSVGMTAHNAKLFKKACADYAKELLDKSKELQSALPFLPSRVNGVLLGSLYAALRADKQFQSLKQIYQQASQLGSGIKTKSTDQALMTNVETLLMKRVQFFAKSVTENDENAHVARETAAPAPDVKRRWSFGAANSESPQQTAECAAAGHESNATPNALVAYAKRHSSSAASGMQLQTATDGAKRRSSVVQALAEARRSVSHDTMPLPPSETRVEEVYRLACRFYGVAANSVLMRRLRHAKENYITTLDLSSNYVGVKGLKPVLTLLAFNGGHLISLSVCNNNIENEEVEQLCCVLSGDAGANLVRLDLSFNPISALASGSLKKLCVALPSLESLQLKATLLPPAVVQELQQIVTTKTAQRHY